MKIKDGFVLKELAGSFMVVPLGSQVMNFSSIIKLSESGAFLWRLLDDEKTIDELTCAMLSEYEVDEAKARADIEKFIKKLEDADLLEK